MIDLMLQTDCENAIRVEAEFLSLPILRLDGNRRGAYDRVAEIRYAEAAFFRGNFPAARNDSRIDEFTWLVPRFGNVDDRHPRKLPNLRRREPNPVRRVHSFKHVVNKFSQRSVKGRYFAGTFFENGIWVYTNLEFR